jgi:hypothetical protein
MIIVDVSGTTTVQAYLSVHKKSVSWLMAITITDQ